MIAREHISEDRQAEYFGHLRYMSHRDNFISFSNWIKDKLEIQQRVEESSVMHKATEKCLNSEKNRSADNQEEDRFTGCKDSDHSKKIAGDGQNAKPDGSSSEWEEVSNKTFQTTIDSLANKSSEPPTQLPKETPVCVFCKKSHLLYECPRFDKIPHKERNKFVRSNRVCFHCLNTGHIASRCDYYPKRVCNVDGCQASHHRKLHPSKDTTSYCYEEEYPDEVFRADLDHVNMHTVSETTNHATNGTYVAIRTVPVILKIGDKK